VFRNEQREVTATTENLLNAYVSAQKQSLVQLCEGGFPDDLAGRYIRQLLNDEFTFEHNNQYPSGRPPYSVLRSYHRYVELAERLSDAGEAT